MKKISVIMVALLFATFGFAQKMQKKNVPANLKSNFQKKYPQATAVKWDKEKQNYEASFKLNNKDHSVLMDANSTILETEVKTDLVKIPKAILTYIKTNYAGTKPKGAAIITDNKGIITYEVEMKGMDIIFDSNGKFINQIKG